MNSVAVTCTALLGLLLFVLAFAVSMSRMKFKISIGYPDDPTHFMRKIVRAHSNTAEYAPFLGIIFLYLGSHQPATWIIYAIALTTLSRFLIVAGLLTCKTLNGPNPLRFIGSVGTYTGSIILAAAMLLGA